MTVSHHCELAYEPSMHGGSSGGGCPCCLAYLIAFVRDAFRSIPVCLFQSNQSGLFFDEQVYQDINTTTNRLDNVVELRRPALPAPSWAPIKPLPAEALLTLKHRLSITAPATVTITFTGTDVNLQGKPMLDLSAAASLGFAVSSSHPSLIGMEIAGVGVCMPSTLSLCHRL